MIGQRVWVHPAADGHLDRCWPSSLAVPIGIYSAVKQYSVGDYARDGAGLLWPIHAHLLDRPDGHGHLRGGAGLVPHRRCAHLRVRKATSSRRWAASSPWAAAIPSWRAKRWPTILDGLHHVALPPLVLTYFNMAGWVRYTRASMLEVLRQDYMRTARAKGLQGARRHPEARPAQCPDPADHHPGPQHSRACLAARSSPRRSSPGRAWGACRSMPSANVDWPVVQGLLVIEAFLVIFSNLLADVCMPSLTRASSTAEAARPRSRYMSAATAEALQLEPLAYRQARQPVGPGLAAPAPPQAGHDRPGHAGRHRDRSAWARSGSLPTTYEEIDLKRPYAPLFTPGSRGQAHAYPGHRCPGPRHRLAPALCRAHLPERGPDRHGSQHHRRHHHWRSGRLISAAGSIRF